MWAYKIKRYFRQLCQVTTLLLVCLLTCIAYLWLTCNNICTDYAANSNNARRSPRSNERSPEAASEHHYLVIFIISAPNAFRVREGIRTSWLKFAKQYGSRVHYRFVVGSAGLTRNVLDRLRDEGDDLLLLATLKDDYYSLTEKLLQTFQWVINYEMRFNYLLKVDDDSFVVLPKLMESLEQIQPSDSMLYYGFIDGRASVKLRGKWADDSWKLCDRYLPHARGGGYVLGYDAVRLLADNSRFLKRYQSEDISVGTWLAGFKVTYKHDVRFDTEYVSRGCLNDYIITHKQNSYAMQRFYANLAAGKPLCGDKEYVLRKAYEYNWNVLPSQCCNRSEPS